MKQKLIAIIFSILLICILISGCQEGDSKDEEEGNVFLDSDLVELKFGNLTYNLDDGEVIAVSVEFLLKNLLDRLIDIDVSAQFFDENDNLLETVGPKNIIIQPLYEESLTNELTYAGLDASEVEYARLIVEENT